MTSVELADRIDGGFERFRTHGSGIIHGTAGHKEAHKQGRLAMEVSRNFEGDVSIESLALRKGSQATKAA